VTYASRIIAYRSHTLYEISSVTNWDYRPRRALWCSAWWRTLFSLCVARAAALFVRSIFGHCHKPSL